jgi:hypothetical protein
MRNTLSNDNYKRGGHGCQSSSDDFHARHQQAGVASERYHHGLGQGSLGDVGRLVETAQGTTNSKSIAIPDVEYFLN